jgi:geranylgeranyl pyrophosphate synthase
MMNTVGSTEESVATEVKDTVAAIMQRGGARLRERMLSTERHLEQVTIEAGVPLAIHATATVAAGGKRLRPLLVMLACEAAGDLGPVGPSPKPATERGGGKVVREDPLDPMPGEEHLVRAAVAVELVHSATLVHDDVIDGAELRRGRPTVVASAGRRIAIATGDLLFSRAFAELARNEDLAQLQVLSDASSALAAGELMQREDAYAPRVAVERYQRRCELKTAALFEAACGLGVLVASEGTAALVDELRTFARRIGLAFQLLDDILDVSGPVERTGKARGTDLLDGTVTLPLILARERDPRLAEIDLASLSGAEQAAELCDQIEATGALEEARLRAVELVEEAKAALPSFLPNGRSALLDLVADAVVERYS